MARPESAGRRFESYRRYHPSAGPFSCSRPFARRVLAAPLGGLHAREGLAPEACRLYGRLAEHLRRVAPALVVGAVHELVVGLRELPGEVGRGPRARTLLLLGPGHAPLAGLAVAVMVGHGDSFRGLAPGRSMPRPPPIEELLIRGRC